MLSRSVKMFFNALLLICSLTTLYAANRDEFSFALPAKEWRAVGDPSGFKTDCMVMRDGAQLQVVFDYVPSIEYSFGTVSFVLGEVAGMAFFPADGKMQVVTRNGQNYMGRMPTNTLNCQVKVVVINKTSSGTRGHEEFQQKSIDPKNVNFVLFKQRGLTAPLIQEQFMSVVLKGGDRFPVILSTQKIHLTDGGSDFSIFSGDILEVHVIGGTHRYSGGIQGYLKGDVLDRQLPFSRLKDESLKILLAKDNQPLTIPWRDIDTIKGDMGELIVTTPYFFSMEGGKRPENMVYVPPGQFVLGNNVSLTMSIGTLPVILTPQPISGESVAQMLPAAQEERRFVSSVEAPSLLVAMPSFFIDKYEVTNREYLRFVVATSHREPAHWVEHQIPEGLEDHPVVNVSYKDVAAYARWMGKRLPTEAEWERAAKGASGYPYPYGPYYNQALGNTDTAGTKSVGSYESQLPSQPYEPFSEQLAIEDMSGNAAEWTCSSFDADWYSNLAKGKIQPIWNPQNLKATPYKVVRGGSFRSSKVTSTTTTRTSMHEDDLNGCTGFRCVWSERADPFFYGGS